jgi:hypothetical protein
MCHYPLVESCSAAWVASDSASTPEATASEISWSMPHLYCQHPSPSPPAQRSYCVTPSLTPLPFRFLRRLLEICLREATTMVRGSDGSEITKPSKKNFFDTNCSAQSGCNIQSGCKILSLQQISLPPSLTEPKFLSVFSTG